MGHELGLKKVEVEKRMKAHKVLSVFHLLKIFYCFFCKRMVHCELVEVIVSVHTSCNYNLFSPLLLFKENNINKCYQFYFRIIFDTVPKL